MAFFLGLDLGQTADYTALIVVEQTLDTPRAWGSPAALTLAHYDVRVIERFPLGTAYPTVVAEVLERLERPSIRGQVTLIVDENGPGAPVLDMLERGSLRPVRVFSHGGQEVTHAGRRYKVPKTHLINTTKVMLQEQRVRIAASHPLAPTLVDELLQYDVKIDPATAHASFGAWRTGIHDDLVFACSLACWWGQRAEKRRADTWAL